MPKEKMLWSFDGLRSVRASKLREFRIEHQNTFDGENYTLRGYFNKTEYFEFGSSVDKYEALNFLNKIHELIEGKK